jgi:hypothetical protein
VTVLIFFALIGFIFWLAALGHKKKRQLGEEEPAADREGQSGEEP